jgi:hypothetical protein
MQIISKITSLISFTFLVTIFVGVHLSCNDNNKCDFVSCSNGGACSGGACTCITGFQGPLCATVTDSEFVGDHIVWDSGTLFGPVTYPINITQGPVVTTLVIRNFYYGFFSDNVPAFIPGPNSFIIQPPPIMGKLIFGNGYFSSNQQIVLNYQVTDISTGFVDIRTMKWTK